MTHERRDQAEQRLIDMGVATRDAHETSELNPNHPVTQQIRTQWHTIAAILLMKLVADERRQELELTEQDVVDFREMVGPGGAIIADTRGGKFVLRIVDGAEAAKLAREAGGLRS